MKKILILLIFIILSCGCEGKKCIRSHEEKSQCVTYSYMYINDVLIPIPHYYDCLKTVCDEYQISLYLEEETNDE